MRVALSLPFTSSAPRTYSGNLLSVPTATPRYGSMSPFTTLKNTIYLYGLGSGGTYRGMVNTSFLSFSSACDLIIVSIFRSVVPRSEVGSLGSAFWLVSVP
jgi:hypothetical protein